MSITFVQFNAAYLLFLFGMGWGWLDPWAIMHVLADVHVRVLEDGITFVDGTDIALPQCTKCAGHRPRLYPGKEWPVIVAMLTESATARKSHIGATAVADCDAQGPKRLEEVCSFGRCGERCELAAWFLTIGHALARTRSPNLTVGHLKNVTPIVRVRDEVLFWSFSLFPAI